MAQKLYVRLFQRKRKWLQVNKLDYVEICSDLQLVAEELVRGGFFQSGKKKKRRKKINAFNSNPKYTYCAE